MRVIYNDVLPVGSYKLLTLGPFIFCREGTIITEEDLNHEKIHWEQQKELLIVGFIVLYILFYLWEIGRCLSDSERGAGIRRNIWKRAYRSVCFEREAYAGEANPNYIYERKLWAWIDILPN